MEDPHGPQTQVHEGTCAIKVSMNCTNAGPAYLRDPEGARTIIICLAPKECKQLMKWLYTQASDVQVMINMFNLIQMITTVHANLLLSMRKYCASRWTRMKLQMVRIITMQMMKSQ